MIPITSFFPAQKKSYKDKNLDWMKSCVDGAQDVAIFSSNNSIRESMYNKQVNYNMYNDILDESDVHRTINPYGINGANFPAKMQNYPICNPKIDLLVGEEGRRKFDWRCRVMNMDAISDKQKMIKDKIMSYLIGNLQAAAQGQQIPEAQIQEDLARLEKWKNYEAQDIRELRATECLNYLYREQEMKLMFNKGMYDVLISAEEQYCTDIVAGEPRVRRVNPLNLYTIRQGESPYTEDSDIVVEYGYLPIGEVIDRYHEYLKPSEVDEIEQGHVWNKGVSVVNYAGRSPILLSEMTETDSDTGALIEVNTKATKYFGGAFDTAGNIRVVRVVWKSLRKIGKLKYYDADGDEQETIVDENYTINKELGEEVKWLWISEWWEGTKIGNDIYVKMGPRPLQFRGMTNLSRCSSGYVGTAYNVNNSKARSLMDRMRPYQYLYNVFMYRTELAFAKSMGKIGKLNLSRIPDGWDVDKWLYYAQIMGWAVEDPFNEGKKGVATGKLAGNMQESSPVIDLEMGAYIQQHISMLSYIEGQMGTISGISAQREAQFQNRETVGGIERAIEQSNYMTEHWFMLHDNTKLRVMTALLETAKEAWKGKNIKKQYIMDDMSTTFMELDGDQFRDAEYGIFVNNSTNDSELFSVMKSLAQAGLQNDKLSFSTLMDIYSSESISQVRRKIEASETEYRQQAANAAAAEKEVSDAQIAAKLQTEQDKIALEKYKIDTDAVTKIQVAQINSFSRQQNQDLDNDLIPDQVELASLALDQQKHASDQYNTATEHRHKQTELQVKKATEKEKMDTQKAIAKIKAEAEKYKADIQLKIAKENQSKAELQAKRKIAAKPKS